MTADGVCRCLASVTVDLCHQGEEEGVGGTPSGLAGNWLALFQVQKGPWLEK
jgi:hypothetical protein